jgi:hypothetical protein
MIRPLDGLRLLLGAVMVVTSLRYFLPPLMPFVPEASWSDPMAVRLISGFDQSGLLAVAKFIHLIAGLLLLTNRAVPFALAALMPVNVCGLFISLFIEGDPLVATLAVLTVALNAVLMLAYLPYYQGLLQAGQLADGEGLEDGRNYESVFVNPMGTASPASYAAAAVVLVSALAFYKFVVPFSNGTTGLVTLAIPSVILAFGWVRSLSRGSRN